MSGRLSAAGIRILLTEDDPSAQKIVPKLLKNYGYQVDVAGDGKEALQALENKRLCTGADGLHDAGE